MYDAIVIAAVGILGGMALGICAAIIWRGYVEDRRRDREQGQEHK